MIPWNSAGQWQEILESLDLSIRLHRHSLGPALRSAQRVGAELTVLSSRMETLARHTCWRCPDSCCSVASVWFDFKDLLYLRLNGIDPPPGQPTSRRGDTCRYLGSRGCKLPRDRRPWICTWHLCPVQTRRLAAGHCNAENRPTTIRQTIRYHRRKMEIEFIRRVAAAPPGQSHVKNYVRRFNFPDSPPMQPTG